MSAWVTSTDLATAPGVPAGGGLTRWAERNGVKRRKRSTGRGWEYHIDTLPHHTRAHLYAASGTSPPPMLVETGLVGSVADTPAATPDAAAPREVSSADLWAWAETQPEERREQGLERAEQVREVAALVATGLKRDSALASVSADYGTAKGTLKNWYLLARKHPSADWAAALIPRPRGRKVGQGRIDIDPRAWDWFISQYMTRGQPTVAEIYRRTVETAEANGWDALPSEDTFARRVEELPLATRVYHREGANALALLVPRQRRDVTVYAPGEAVNGDGLKFDKLFVEWPDGEILTTSTGWFWQDVRTGRLLAHRLAKTENTDLFRLATYDLTAVCLPAVAWMDNTTVAANLAMTGQAQGRHRFAHARRAEDPLGLLLQLGIEPHFTDPSREYASPGSKRIERAFGIGGLHSEVAHNPRLAGRGHRKSDPVSYAEFAEVVAEEVARFNARAKRRSAECAGVKSYDQLWTELLDQGAILRAAPEAQRRLLLLMVEVCKASATTGEITVKAGSSHLGAARYWADWMPEIRGKKVAVYFDPADLQRPVTVYDMAGLRLGEAARLADAGHNDTDAARESRKARARVQKAMKKQAQDDVRISALRAAEQYPAAPQTTIPAPGVVNVAFGEQGRRVLDDGTLVDPRTGEVLSDTAPDSDREARFAASVADLAARRQRANAV